MVWNIQAAEDLISGDFVEFIKDGEGKLSCKKALELESIRAIGERHRRGGNAQLRYEWRY